MRDTPRHELLQVVHPAVVELTQQVGQRRERHLQPASPATKRSIGATIPASSNVTSREASVGATILEGKVNLVQNKIWCCKRGGNDQRHNVSMLNRVARHWVLVFSVWPACVCDSVPSTVLYLIGDCKT